MFNPSIDRDLALYPIPSPVSIISFPFPSHVHRIWVENSAHPPHTRTDSRTHTHTLSPRVSGNQTPARYYPRPERLPPRPISGLALRSLRRRSTLKWTDTTWYGRPEPDPNPDLSRPASLPVYPPPPQKKILSPYPTERQGQSRATIAAPRVVSGSYTGYGLPLLHSMVSNGLCDCASCSYASALWSASSFSDRLQLCYRL